VLKEEEKTRIRDRKKGKKTHKGLMLREGFLSGKGVVVGVLHALVNLMEAGSGIRGSIGSGFGVECGSHGWIVMVKKDVERKFEDWFWAPQPRQQPGGIRLPKAFFMIDVVF
jgi:hypothetical protein